jgi:hypothetical protein
MKNFILRVSTVAFAAALGGTMACGGSSCGGTNINSSGADTTLSNSCGQGTYLSGTQCVPLPTIGGAGNTNKPASNVITN